MIFPGFPGVLSFFQVFQVEWEPCLYIYNAKFSISPIPIVKSDKTFLTQHILAV